MCAVLQPRFKEVATLRKIYLKQNVAPSKPQSFTSKDGAGFTTMGNTYYYVGILHSVGEHSSTKDCILFVFTQHPNFFGIRVV